MNTPGPNSTMNFLKEFFFGASSFPLLVSVSYFGQFWIKIGKKKNGMNKEIIELGYNLKLLKSLKDFLGEIGFDEEYVARPLNRAIQK